MKPWAVRKKVKKKRKNKPISTFENLIIKGREARCVAPVNLVYDNLGCTGSFDYFIVL